MMHLNFDFLQKKLLKYFNCHILYLCYIKEDHEKEIYHQLYDRFYNYNHKPVFLSVC